MAPGESIIHYYAMAITRLGLVLIVGGIVIGWLWYKWVKSR